MSWILRGAGATRRATTYPVGMARSSLTLAALATSAVAGLDVTAASRIGGAPGASFDQAVLTTGDSGRVVIRVPRMQSAENRSTADLASLAAMSTGIRSRLPFAVPSFLGQTPINGTRAVVVDYLPGEPVRLDSIIAGGALADSIGRALAALHSLPTSFVSDAGLPVVRPLDTLATSVTVMDQASATGLVPAALLDRWESATEDPALWQFAPTVIHGAVSADVVLQTDGRVTGIVDWFALGVGDPARDLFWVLGASGTDAVESVFDAYNQARGQTDRQVKKRAMLYAELEIAKWLLHGTQERSTEIVDDAVEMLHNLVDIVQNDLDRRIDTDTRPVMTVTEVQEMLDRDDRHQATP